MGTTETEIESLVPITIIGTSQAREALVPITVIGTTKTHIGARGPITGMSTSKPERRLYPLQ